MGIGVSVFLIAVGAILAFALNLRIGILDLDAVGWILMAAGALGLIITTMIWSNRRREVVTRDPVVERAPVERERTIEERRSY